MGRYVDSCERSGNLGAAFAVIAGTIAVLAVIDLISLMSISSYQDEKPLTQRTSFKQILRQTLGNKNFRNIVIMLSLFDFGSYLTIGFLGTYKTQELLYSVGTVQIINIIASLSRCVLSRQVGKWADRTSFSHVYRKGLYLNVFSYLLLFFTNEATRWLIIPYTICYHTSMTGINGNSNNMTYSYVPQEYFVQAQAIRSSISGTLGFCASLIGSRILQSIQLNGNQLFGIQIYGQQLLAFMSLVIILSAAIFNKLVISKQTVMKQ